MIKKQKIGIVISTNSNKTAAVNIFTLCSHPKYKKRLIKKTKFLVHDEYNLCRIGDFVIIEESSPISKLKNWKFKETLKKA